MTWLELFVRGFGWVVALLLFLVGKEVWDRWKEKSGKEVSKYSRAKAPTPEKRVLLSAVRGCAVSGSERCLALSREDRRTGNLNQR